MSSEPVERPRRRPRDRRAQIAAAAATRFYQHGFQNVSIGTIAADVGITAGAIYRHFDNKQDLLAHTLVDVFDASTADVVTAAGRTELPTAISALAARSAARRDLGVLWNRESRHLDTAARREMFREFFTFVAGLTGLIQSSRPELTPAQAELLTWAALASLTSPSYHQTELAEVSLRRLLERMAMAIVTTELPTPGPDRGPGEPIGLRPSSRRETILAAATTLFASRGYGAVTLDDIGRAVGVTSTAVYRHFDSKSELLSATINRAAEPLHLGLTRALTGARSAEDGMLRALGSYVEFAIEHHQLLGLLVSEVPNLPEPHRTTTVRAQQEYVAEWKRLLREARPELDARTATFLVHGTLTVVNDVARTRPLRARADVADNLTVLGHRLLAL
jgi:AcrR family transcriptional regulator